MKRRLLSLLLCGVMVFSLCFPSAFAKANTSDQVNESGAGHTRLAISADGLCEHHSGHTTDR